MKEQQKTSPEDVERAAREFVEWTVRHAMAAGIGKRILLRLDELGMTQRELAKACHLTEVTVSRYVNYQRIPNAVSICMISRALGMTPNELLGWEETNVHTV